LRRFSVDFDPAVNEDEDEDEDEKEVEEGDEIEDNKNR